MKAQGCGTATWPRRAQGIRRIARSFASTPFRPTGSRCLLDKITKNERLRQPIAGETSAATAGYGRADDAIRQKVMGRGVTVARNGGSGVRLGFGGTDAALALLDEPAGDQGVGVLVEILVEQGSDLFPQVGGVAEPAQFVALQGGAGSGEKELPRRLGALAVHKGLQYRSSNVLRGYSSTENPMVTSNSRVYGLWKSVENEEKPRRACSGCAGDYEDPDRSAWEEESGKEGVEEAADEPGSGE